MGPRGRSMPARALLLPLLTLAAWLTRYHTSARHVRTAVTAAAAPADTTSMRFQVLQYNLFGRPSEVSRDGQPERLTRVPASLLARAPELDVVTFAEVDVASEREEMLTQFRAHGFAFATSILHDPNPFTSLLNGGVLVVSRWPIVREAQHVYRGNGACHYSDCLAAKGVKYARVVKSAVVADSSGNGSSHTTVTKVFNVFATHMQAWSTPAGRSARIMQAQQMRAFVDALRLPHHEPVVLAGDFNVDNHTYADEVQHLINLLGAHSPHRIGEQLFTSDPRSNVLVGRDGAAHSDKCSAQYEASWGPLVNGAYYPSALTRVTCGSPPPSLRSSSLVFMQPESMCYCPCCPREWIDYVLYAQAPYQQPKHVPTLECHENRVSPFLVDWSAPLSKSAKMQLVDLSDHYPVTGSFEFAVDRSPGRDNDPATVHLDGCSTDADCTFRSFRCYCTGSQCFFNGTRTDGSHLDSHHPVNRNCLYQKTSFRCLCGPT